jgi:hypothetical protein
MGTVSPSPEVKWPGREPNHSTSSDAEVKNAWSHISTYHCLYVLVLNTRKNNLCLIKIPAMNMYGWRERIALPVLNLGYRRM